MYNVNASTLGFTYLNYYFSADEFSVAPVIMKWCWLFSCRQLDSKETYLADVSTGCSSPPQGESEAESRNLAIYTLFVVSGGPMLIGVYVVRVLAWAPRAFRWACVCVCVVRMLAPPLNFSSTTVGKLEAIVTIEAFALWFRSDTQRFLHDQLHGPTSSL